MLWDISGEMKSRKSLCRKSLVCLCEELLIRDCEGHATRQCCKYGSRAYPGGYGETVIHQGVHSGSSESTKSSWMLYLDRLSACLHRSLNRLGKICLGCNHMNHEARLSCEVIGDELSSKLGVQMRMKNVPQSRIGWYAKRTMKRNKQEARSTWPRGRPTLPDSA